MKLLIIFNHPAPYKVDLFNELTKNNKVDVIFERNKARNRPNEFYCKNNYLFNFIKVSGFKLNIGNENCYTSFVKKYIQNNHSKYDLIVMNGYSTFAEMSAIKYMKKNNIPFVLLINGGIVNSKELFLKRKIKRNYIGSAKYYLSPCDDASKYLCYYGASPSKIYTYPYSNIHLSDIQVKPLTNKERNYIRDEYFLPRETLYICPGQFIRRKNNLTLIKLFKNKQEKLLLVGNGPLKNKYLRYIKKKNIKNVFVWDFLPQDKLREIMKSCDGLISLSKHDIYGHTILEAMACGIPVFASKNIVSAQEIIKNGLNGYILDKNKSLFEQIKKSSEINRPEIIKTAKKYAIENSAKVIDKNLRKCK